MAVDKPFTGRNLTMQVFHSILIYIYIRKLCSFLFSLLVYNTRYDLAQLVKELQSSKTKQVLLNSSPGTESKDSVIAD